MTPKRYRVTATITLTVEAEVFASTPDEATAQVENRLDCEAWWDGEDVASGWSVVEDGAVEVEG
jgi:hypothetical protein